MKNSYTRTRILTTALISAFVFSAGIAAARGNRPRGDHMFEKADTNSDGQITRNESKQVADARFNQFDANSDGSVTQEEIKTAMESKRAARQEKRAAHSDDAKEGKRGEHAKEGKHAQRDGAQDTSHKKHGGNFFARLDTNGDGTIDHSEADAFETEHFNRMDTNQDGAITKAEIQAKSKAMKAKRQEKHAVR